MTIEYKIRDTKTGMFSKGGSWPCQWSKKGKTWNSIGALRNHLRLIIDDGRYPSMNRPIPETWEVVEINVVSVPGNVWPATSYLKKEIP